MKQVLFLRNRIKLISSVFCIMMGYYVAGQDTFSIVAVDPETGQVGSAGASCLDDGDIAGGVSIIGDLLPGKGAINTQSYWNSTNQQNARIRMEEGDAPEEIMDWLQQNDVQSNPGIRQYGAADFDESGLPRAAAFTGANCFDYKNHIVGENYSIQGNILLGQEILDSMEVRFLAKNGTLAEKLMAALQGANVPGADTRCASQFTSSESAFLRVANPMDSNDSLYLDIVIGSTPFGSEPIDALQESFDAWLLSHTVDPELSSKGFSVFPNPATEEINLDWEGYEQGVLSKFTLFDRGGVRVLEKELISRNTKLSLDRLTVSGMYFYQLTIDGNYFRSGIVQIQK